MCRCRDSNIAMAAGYHQDILEECWCCQVTKKPKGLGLDADECGQHLASPSAGQTDARRAASGRLFLEAIAAVGVNRPLHLRPGPYSVPSYRFRGMVEYTSPRNAEALVADCNNQKSARKGATPPQDIEALSRVRKERRQQRTPARQGLPWRFPAVLSTTRGGEMKGPPFR